MISIRAMQPLRSGIDVSTNAGSNARTSPDLPDQQNPLAGRSRQNGIHQIVIHVMSVNQHRPLTLN
jgi:hypothetical protein